MNATTNAVMKAMDVLDRVATAAQQQRPCACARPWLKEPFACVTLSRTDLLILIEHLDTAKRGVYTSRMLIKNDDNPEYPLSHDTVLVRCVEDGDYYPDYILEGE